MGEHHPERRDARSYYRFPLPEDARDSVTLLRLEPASDGRLRIHLHRGINQAAFGMRFAGLSEPRWQAVAEPTRTLVTPTPGAPGLTGPETVLADLGSFLAGVVLGDGGIYPWYLEGLMRNEQWLLHLRQLCVLHERLAPVRTSPVADDPRVVARVGEIVTAAEPHAQALLGWLQQAREIREEARATAEAELHERRVRAVLDHLAGPAREDARSRPNPELRRIRTP
ncbi:hypothetical protein [Ornithinimicrobium pekingense]|uniref:Uncharacterized protein n=1 Tax=Ornithinimicrobium pekingense TaxID=384677 RepID=A0ABQ2FCV5_9MICO|nr:hypothetical protein [Ornithinimicrobium pekingense]GGK76518.1 hypothetical protein GCM10011509_26390 [Ornithinimicrobium pekingense]